MRMGYAVPLIWLALATSAAAQVLPPLEINQTCAVEIGCFPGDDPGFPVTITQPGNYILTSNLVNDYGGSSSGSNRIIISQTPLLVGIDLRDFTISGTNNTNGLYPGGISGSTLRIQNGTITYVSFGVNATQVWMEDAVVRAAFTGVRGSESVDLRRVTVENIADMYVGVSCGSCFLQDVEISVDSTFSVSAGEGFFERVRTPVNSQFLSGGSVTILESNVGSFDLGDDSSISATTVACVFSLPRVGGSGEGAAGDNFRLIDSTLSGVCYPRIGVDAYIENSSFGALRASARALLRNNSVSHDSFNLIPYSNIISVGEHSIVESNAIVTLGGSGAGADRVGVVAGEGARIFNNSIEGANDGIICAENCLVANNSVTDYSNIGITLAPTSYYFGNDIDDSGIAKVSGGINLEPKAIGLPSPAAALDTTAPTDSSSDIFPQIATDGVGQWLTVWQSNNDLGGSIGSDVDIVLARSSDDGLTWTDPVALNKTAEDDSANDVEPVIIADAAGNWVAAWSSTEDLGGTVGEDRDILFSRSADAGATWTNVGALNTNAAADSGSDERPFITTNGGIFLAAWQSNDGAIGPDYDIWVAQSFTGGASWAAPILLNSTGGSDSADDVHPALSTDSAGNWIAVWESNEAALGGDGDLMVARSMDDGTTWTAPIPLNQNATTDTGLDAWPTIKTDGAGTWVVAWESNEDLDGMIGTDRDLLFARSVDNGTTWSPPQPLNGDAANDLGDDANPNLISDSAGGWTVVWESGEDFVGTIGADFDIFVSRSTDDGITWSGPELLNKNGSTDLGGDYNPKIMTNASGDRSVVVWHSDDDLVGTVGPDWDVLFTGVDRCSTPGALLPSTPQLAAFQINWCEDWSGVSQPGEDLEATVLNGSDLSLANLSGASLQNASLIGADLSGADLSTAAVTGALYDESTLFPSGNTYDTPPWGIDGGISPWDAGMIPVPEPSVGWLLLAGVGVLAGVSTKEGAR